MDHERPHRVRTNTNHWLIKEEINIIRLRKVFNGTHTELIILLKHITKNILERWFVKIGIVRNSVRRFEKLKDV